MTKTITETQTKKKAKKNPAEGDGDINQEVEKAVGNEETEEDEEMFESIGGEEAGDQIIVAGNVEGLDNEDEESRGKKKKVIRTPVSIIYIVAPKQSSQETDAQKTKKRRADNDL